VDLVRLALAEGLTLLTTDTAALRLRAVRAGAVDVVWLPPAHGRLAQLALVLRDLELARREPRCMGCGGDLRPVPKEEVLERIPPRTRRWREDYFLCAGCGALFWHGTHWEKIARRLAQEAAAV
jgi:uncharacterized protein with PIN domain